MTVIQELISTTGNLQDKVIKNVVLSNIRPVDNLVLSITKHQQSIFFKEFNYHMIFRSIKLRDEAYKIIIEGLTKNTKTVVIDIEKFYETLLTKEQLNKELENYTLGSALYNAVRQINTKHQLSIDDIYKLDAFNVLSKTKFKAIIKKTFTKSATHEEHIFLWARTLPYPKKFHSILSPTDYWRHLYHKPD